MVEGEGTRVPEALLGDLRNYDDVGGLRAKFKRVNDEDATKQAGFSAIKKAKGLAAAKAASDADLMAAGKRKGKVGTKSAGKEFERDQLLIAEVISLPDAKKGGKKPKAAKPAAEAAAPAADAPATDTSSPEATDAILKTIVQGAGGTIEIGKLSAAAVRYGLKAKMDAKGYNALRDLVTGEEYLAGAVERNVIAIEGEGKERVLIAA